MTDIYMKDVITNQFWIFKNVFQRKYFQTVKNKISKLNPYVKFMKRVIHY